MERMFNLTSVFSYLQDPDAETSPSKRRGALKPWDDGEEGVVSEGVRLV